MRKSILTRARLVSLTFVREAKVPEGDGGRCEVITVEVVRLSERKERHHHHEGGEVSEAQ
jgi:hypothetical protein